MENVYFCPLHYLLVGFRLIICWLHRNIMLWDSNDIAAFLSKINNKLYDNVVPVNACFIPNKNAE